MSSLQQERGERVLILAPEGQEAPVNQHLLQDAGLVAETCPDMDALCHELDQGAGALLLAQQALTSANLQQLTVALERQPAWSEVPVTILLTPGPISQTAPLLVPLAVLRSATYLAPPVRTVTLISTLRAALATRRRQYEMGEILADRERAAKDLRESGERLKDADRRKDQFLALLGHELRNPLAAISNGVRALTMAKPEPDRTQHIAAIIDRQTRHLTRLVDDLLDVSRVTAGKITLKRRPVELNALVEQCRQAVAEAAGGHQLLLRPAPSPVWTDGDPVRLEQVVMNLLSNAIKYTPPGGTITLSVSQEQGSAVLRVRDDGIGMAPEILPHVFDLFSQAPQALDRAQGGLGIGLTLVRSLIALHGGMVAAHSAGPGQGSEFTVRLPLIPAPQAERHPASEEAATPPRRIVIIEDNPDLSATLQEILQDMGHSVQAVSDGQAGVVRVMAERPDVALIDIGLPGIDGYEVARRIRANVTQEILLIAMTGYGQPEDRRRSKDAGFDAHLTKPPKLDMLESLLRSGKAPSLPH